MKRLLTLLFIIAVVAVLFILAAAIASADDVTVSFTAGEDIARSDGICLKYSDGKYYKTSTGVCHGGAATAVDAISTGDYPNGTIGVGETSGDIRAFAKVSVSAGDAIFVDPADSKLTTVSSAYPAGTALSGNGGSATNTFRLKVNVTPSTGGGGHVIQDEGVDLPSEPKLNFTGAGVTAADNAGVSTDVTITGSAGSNALLDGTVHSDTVANSVAKGDLIQGNATPKWDVLAGNTTTTVKYLQSTGTGAAANLASWMQITYTDIASRPALPLNNTGVAHSFFSTYNSTTGAFGLSQPACGDLSDSAGGCSMSTTAGGDLQGTYPDPTTKNISGGTTFGALSGGYMKWYLGSAPAAPNVIESRDYVWIDSPTMRFHDIDSYGNIGTTVIADTGATSQFLTAISGGGVISKAQPAFTDINGLLLLNQLTDDATAGKCLLSGGGGGDPAWTACPGGAGHDMLSTTHTDSTAASVTRGGLITGQGATPKWTLLTVGGSNTVLTSDGTDVAWGTVPAGSIAPGADDQMLISNGSAWEDKTLPTTDSNWVIPQIVQYNSNGNLLSGTESLVPVAMTRKHGFCDMPATSSTLPVCVNLVAGTPAAFGTATLTTGAQTNSTAGLYWICSSRSSGATSGDACGLQMNSWAATELQWNPTLYGRVRIHHNTTARFWFALSSGQLDQVSTNVTNRATRYIGIAFDTGVASNFQCCSSVGTGSAATSSCTDMGIAPAASTVYRLAVDFSDGSTIRCMVASDDLSTKTVITKTSNLPTSTIDMAPTASITTLTNSAHDWGLFRLDLYQN